MSCNHDCENCSDASCSSRDLLIKTNELNNIKKIYAVISGKGGVGKSMVTSLLASHLSRRGHSVGILDADITGPSIPKSFGLKEKAYADQNGIIPQKSIGGIKIMSINLLLSDETDPVIWRGPIISGVVEQFYRDVIWGDLDVLLIDMPPGTGDVALTVFQSLPIDGIVVVTSPQELVYMIVEKAEKMIDKLDIPIIGMVENLSYFHCPDNGKDYQIFGESHIDDVAKKHNIKAIAKMPIEPSFATLQDRGEIEKASVDSLNEIINFIDKTIQ